MDIKENIENNWVDLKSNLLNTKKILDTVPSIDCVSLFNQVWV
jgi:hypothetical protein